MPPPKPADVDAYLAAQPPEVRAALVKVRTALRRALPASVEAIKYGMPAYLVDGRAVVSFAGWKNHYALYIVETALFDAIARELPAREASKGIIRFALDESVPASLLARLASWSAAGPAALPAAKTKKAQKKPAPPKPKQPEKKTAASRRAAAPARRRER
jgi:uncharacterized protein YdhG (YjbR/CyaY superfamily)